ncbi:MAG: NUDIX hydrolase [Anaerocolumna sp.]
MKKNHYCKNCGNICEEFMDGEITRIRCSKCGFIYYQNPFPCVSVLAVDDLNRILLGLRGTESIYSGKWCLPCGYMEYNESYVEAAVRETMEETGILVRPQGIINVVSNAFDNGINSIVTVILAKPETMCIKPGDDIIKADWFDLNGTLPELAFDADVYIINKYLNALHNNKEIDCLDLGGSSF